MPIFPLVLPERPSTEPDHAELYLSETWVTCRPQMAFVGETGPRVRARRLGSVQPASPDESALPAVSYLTLVLSPLAA